MDETVFSLTLTSPGIIIFFMVVCAVWFLNIIAVITGALCLYRIKSKMEESADMFFPLGIAPLNFGEDTARYAAYIARKLAYGRADKDQFIPSIPSDKIDPLLPSLQDIVRYEYDLLLNGEKVVIATDGNSDMVWLEMSEEGFVKVCCQSNPLDPPFWAKSCLYIKNIGE